VQGDIVQQDVDAIVNAAKHDVARRRRRRRRDPPRGRRGAGALLASAYRRSLELGAGAGLRSIAFPSMSTGANRFPIREASGIALATTTSFLAGARHSFECVRFVVFSAVELAVYTEVLGQV
jgi:O-acetyl-ADP-ribose deacetylase (regulator of RNase III)